MSLRLTPDILVAGYSFLRETRPIKGWRLPPADDVGFHVVKDRSADADFIVIGGVPTIRVSVNGSGHTDTLMASIAHEICHLRQHLKGWPLNHGIRFRSMGAAICREHGFDLKTF